MSRHPPHDDSFFGPAGSPSAGQNPYTRARQEYGLPRDPSYRPHQQQFDTSHQLSDDLEDSHMLMPGTQYASTSRTPGMIPRTHAVADLSAAVTPGAIDFSEPADYSFADDSAEQYDESHDAAGAEEELEVDEAQTTYQESDGSSAAIDPDEDPEGWAERLDELAGVLEMGEAESRAVRWGPAIASQRGAPDLPFDDFRKVLDHHLKGTEWRFEHPSTSWTGLEGPAPFLTGASAVAHPIRVLGRRHMGREASHRVGPLMAMRELALEDGLGAVNV